MKTTFTTFKLEEIRQLATEIINNMDKGMSLKDILATVYVSGFANKSMMQGYVMAEGVIETINSFEADFNNAKANLDNFIDEKLNKVAEGKTRQERCELWFRLNETISNAMTIIKNNEQADINDVAKNINSNSVLPEEVSEEYEACLYEELKQTMNNSGVLLSSIFENISDFAMTEDTGLLVEVGLKEYDVRAVMSMLTYINLKNNRITNIPADTTIEQITTLVCVETETAKIMEAAGKSMTKGVAELLLNILGTIAICGAIFAAVIGGAAYIITIFEGSILSLLAIPFIIGSAFKIDEIITVACNDWEKQTKKIIDTVSISLKNIRKGLVKLKRHLTEDDMTFDTETVKNKELVTV